jgi:hypothetical protein
MAVWDIKERNALVRANQIRGNRGFFSAHDVVSFIDVSSTGNATDFGDMSQGKSNKGGIATPARVIFGGGYTSPAGKKLEHFTPTSLGNGADFGDLSTVRALYGGAASNHVRGIFMGGEAAAPSYAKQNVIDFITISSLGDATDFGDLTSARYGGAGIATSTRVCYGGGNPGSNSNVIDFGTIASTGNFADFGDLTSVRRGCPGANSTTRGLVFKGANAESPEPDQLFIDYFEIATTGNAADFGDATVRGRFGGALSNNIRGVAAGGSDPSTNVIDFVQVSTLGDATDFGDLLSTTNPTGACVGHGGIDLDSTAIQRPSVTYMPGSGRGFIGGGEASPGKHVDMIHIPTLGNATDFGDLPVQHYGAGACSNGTRGVWGANTDRAVNMSSLEFQSLGNGADFGDLTVGRQRVGSHSSTTRGVFAGGQSGSAPNYDEYDTIDYITIASAGNAADFGDLTVQRWFVAPGGSPTRGVFGSGVSNPAGYSNVIDYITVASTGDATDFGDMLAATGYTAGCSSSVRQVFGGGYTPSAINVMQYVTIASTGNSTDFGDLLDTTGYATGTSNNTRGIFAGDLHPSSTNVIQYITIASTGNSADFGDLNNAGHSHGTTSDSHGGLQV